MLLIMLMICAVKEGSIQFGQNYAAAEDCYHMAAQKNAKNPVCLSLSVKRSQQIYLSVQ